MVRMTEFHEQCVAINKRLHDVPGKTETNRLYRKLYKPGLASRILRGKMVYFCTECGCTINPIGQKECPQCHTKWTEKKTLELRNRRVDKELRDIAIFEAKATSNWCAMSVWSARCNTANKPYPMRGR